jgi:hypothetical protein
MRSWLEHIKSNPWLMKRLVVLALLAGACGGGFWWGQKHTIAKIEAKGKENDPFGHIASGRVVAELYGGKVQVSREEFAEYLIARFGKERLDFMLNRKIVDIECAKHGITAVDAEIEDRLKQDLIAYSGGSPTPLSLHDFEASVLKRFGKTLFEWKEDVIRPKIMMEKLVRSTVDVTEADLKKAFEASFGPKVDCRMIILDGKDVVNAQKVWELARRGRNDFLEQARKSNFIPQLQQAEGKVPPFHRHMPEKDLEDAAFRLKPGEISGLLTMPDGTRVILLCEKHLPEDASVKMETVRPQLFRQVKEMRVAQKLPEVFAEMRRVAMPRPMLDNRGTPSASILPASFSKEAITPVPPGQVQSPPGVQPLPPDRGPLAAPNIPNPIEKK